MEVFKALQEWRAFRGNLSGKSIGFVPTMGALHEGHAFLLAQARKENDFVVLSIYVNETQFNSKDDLSKYPVNLDLDLALAERHQVDAVILPNYLQMYPDNYTYKVSEVSFSRELCGAHRPGHFDGVLSVVMKLFHLVQPAKVYFGEKDFQQLELIKGMVRAFFMDLEVIACPTVREPDGLALSSRNQLLTPSAREKAPLLFKLLKSSLSPKEIQERLTAEGFHVDYIHQRGGRRYIAATIEGVRLIDNVEYSV